MTRLLQGIAGGLSSLCRPPSAELSSIDGVEYDSKAACLWFEVEVPLEECGIQIFSTSALLDTLREVSTSSHSFRKMDIGHTAVYVLLVRRSLRSKVW